MVSMTMINIKLLTGLESDLIVMSVLIVVQDDIDFLLGVDKDLQQRNMAQFILKLKEAKQVSQVVIDEIVEGCTVYFNIL